MTVTDDREDEDVVLFNFTGSAVAGIVIGAVLAIGARSGAVELLAAVAVVQALLAPAVLWGLHVPGRKGGLVLAALAAGGADVAVSVWPHSKLGTLLPVIALAVPLLIAHQLMRGAARVRVLESLGSIAFLVLAETALASFVQLRHEFTATATGGKVVFAVVLIVIAALVVGLLVDLIVAAPRFDHDVPRGLLALIASAVVGALVGYLTLRDTSEFAGSRGLFAGASLGVLAGLVAVGVTFAEFSAEPGGSGFGRRIRPVLAIVVPLSVLAPVAFLLCLAIRA